MSDPNPQRAPRAPTALSAEYHKAHKQLMLWSGILFIWELVGIDLTKAEEAEGMVGSIVKSIKSPQAVPWALLVLVGYFLFKLIVEWSQCDGARRKMWASKADFISALVVALSAYALYTYQAINQVQFADVVQTSDKVLSSVLGFFMGFGLTAIASRLFLRYKFGPYRVAVPTFIYGISMILVSIISMIIRRNLLSLKYVLIGFGFGALSDLPLSILIWRRRREIDGE